MDVVLLGTGSPLPDANRAGAATLVRTGAHQLLFDCGRGVMMRLAAVGLPFPWLLSRVFLTHLHSDHITDFNDLVTTGWATSPVEQALRVTGPAGTQALADRTLAMLTDDIGWRMAHHDDLQWRPAVDVQEVSDGVVWEADGVRVVAAPTEHKPVHPTVGYRIEAEGKVVAIAGDTVPCEGLDRLCAGADVYVQTVVRPDLIAMLPSPRLQDVLDYHSSCEQAGATAARGGVRTLVLTHPVPAPMPGDEDTWVKQARDGAGDGWTGEVVLGHDLLTVTA